MGNAEGGRAERRDRQLFGGALALLSLLLVGSLWIVPYLPTNDGPQSVFAVHVENHYSDPGTVYADAFTPALQFASRGFGLIMGPLEAWLGWAPALRVTLSLTVLVAAWGFVALVCAIDPRRWALSFLGFPLALTWELYMGFFAFSIGSGIGLFVLALAVARPAPSPVHRLLVAVLLLLQAIAHVFSAVLTGAVVVALLTTRAAKGQRVPELLRAVAMGLPAAFVFIAATLSRGRLAHLAYADAVFFPPLSRLAGTLPRIIAPGPWPRAVLVALAVLVGAAIHLVRARRDATSSVDRALGLSGVAFLAASVAVPLHIPGWQYLSPRFVPLATSLIVAGLPLERLSFARVSRFMPVALFGVATLWLGLSYSLHRRLGAAAKDALAGLDAPVRRVGVWLPFVLDHYGGIPDDPVESDVPYLVPLLHIGGLYATTLGGVTPYTFGMSAATYPFLVRPHGLPARPVPDLALIWDTVDSEEFKHDPRVRAAVEHEMTTFGAYYEGVVVTGARAEDVALWRSANYAVDWQGGSVIVAHYAPPEPLAKPP